MPGGGLGGHVLVPVGTDTGGPAVDPPGGRDLPRGTPGPLHPPHRTALGNGTDGTAGKTYDTLDTESGPVEDHGRRSLGRHGLRRIHGTRRHHAQTPLDPSPDYSHTKNSA
ncbi:hypothetical protein GCM10010339_71690 [Streptomyces alanosinicus]|uniref:Uncharacterized protein n=1 Tax=Streptomyces alanosinicus TaxID=68171 RepID=A0A919D681_9ACTN|nr:hypothetical protein GCM10010339_71690 [Streptomyces alanosinicus]